MPKKLRVVFCALTLVFVVALIVVFTFRVHILFAYQLHTNETPFVDIKISELSNNPVPQNWETFTIGSVTFQVPPGFEYLNSNRQTGKEKQIYRNGITVLKKEKMLLIFDEHEDSQELFQGPLSKQAIRPGLTRHKSLPSKGNSKTRFLPLICSPWGFGCFRRIGKSEILKSSGFSRT